MEERELPEKKVKLRRKIRIILVVVFICIIISTFTIAVKNYKMKSSQSATANPKSHAEEVKVPIDNNTSNMVNNNRDITKRESNIPEGVNMDDYINQLGIPNKKVAYLTFDDGPSRNITPQVLDILDHYNIKATFFVIGRMVLENKDILIREKKEGEAIGDHTFTHNYKYEYEKPQNIVNDFNKGADAIRSILGENYNVKYVRFPGGSFGKKLYPFRIAVENAGYSFIDWNCINGDAEGNNIAPNTLIETVKNTSARHNTLVILMHDASTKTTTVQALPKIIEFLKSQGYIFKILQ